MAILDYRKAEGEAQNELEIIKLLLENGANPDLLVPGRDKNSCGICSPDVW